MMRARVIWFKPRKRGPAMGLTMLMVLAAFCAISFGNPGMCTEPLRVDAAAGQGETRRCGNGQVTYVEGIPFLTLSGSYYEMGYQYGILLKQELSEVFRFIRLLKESVLARYPWYVRPFGRIALEMMINYNWKRVPDKYKDELRGLSAGAEIPFDDIAFSAVFLELTSKNCTCLLGRTETGVIHGRNLDFQPLFLGRFPVVIEYHPDGKYSYISFSVIGYTGIFTGINETGLSVSLNAAFGYKKHIDDVPIAYKLRDMLEMSSTIDDLDVHLQGYDTEAGWVLAAGSLSENNGAMYDINAGIVKKTALNGKKFLFAVNRFVDPEVNRKFSTISIGTSYFNLARLDTIARLQQLFMINSVNDAINVLSNADFGPYLNLIGTGNGTINNERTLQTIVFCLEQHKVYFAFSRGYAGWAKYLCYDWKTKEVTDFRASDERLTDDVIDYLNWYEKSEIDLIRQAFNDITQDTWQKKYLNPVQLLAIDMVQETKENLIDPGRFLQAIDDAIGRYNDYGLLYQLKGQLLLSRERYDEAIAALEQGIKAVVLFPPEKIAIYSLLARAYHVKHQEEQALSYAKSCVELIDRLSVEYVVGPDEMAIRESMSRMIGEKGGE